MMTVHVLHAGDGYSYLTNQVAAGDQQVRRSEELTDYYTAEGAKPGQWWGNGLASLGVSGQVSAEQMQALFGEGLRPDATTFIQEQIAARGVSILLVEQKLAIAMRISHRLYVMGHGRCVFEGTPASLAANAGVRKEWLEV